MILRHPQTPGLAKFFLCLALGYLMLPFDLIPDFIPILGQLDDVLIVPGLIYLALRLIPETLVNECRSQLNINKEETQANGRTE